MTKPTIVTRAGKGTALTYGEQDANFTNLQNATITVTDGTNSKAIDLNGTITFTGLTVNSSTGVISATTGNFVTVDTTQTITGLKTLNQYAEQVYTGGNIVTSLTPDSNNGPVQTFTATTSFTLNIPTNMVAGKSVVLIITQDGTGSRLMTPDSALKFAGGIKSLSLIANSVDMLSIFYTGTAYLCSINRRYS